MDFTEVKALLQASWPGWEPVRLIGKGSFGAVYEIQKNNGGKIDRQALKVISVPEDGAVLPMGRDKATLQTYYASIADGMVQEYETMRALMNDGCVNVVGCDNYVKLPNSNGIGLKLLIKMELLTDLNTYVRKHGFSRQEVVQLGIDVCRALEACRQEHVFHRDIKPANLFVSKDGVYKLGDFGVAKRLEQTGYAGSKQGTIMYMAPEVYKNQSYDGRADMYSLGLVMYQMMNQGQLPFITDLFDDKTQGEALQRRMRGEAFPMPAAEHGELARVVCRACEYDYRDRYAGPTEMRLALERLLDPRDRFMYLNPVDEPDVRVRFLENDGTILQERSYQPGEKIIRPQMRQVVEQNGKRFRFLGWEPALPETATMTMDYRATYQEETVAPPASPHPHPWKKWLPVIAACLVFALAVVTVAVWQPWNGVRKAQEDDESLFVSDDGENISGSAHALSLNSTELTLVLGQTEQLKATVLPDNVAASEIEWTVKDSSVVSVEDGVVTALKSGETTITATVGDVSTQCAVSVLDREVKSVEIVHPAYKDTYFVRDTLDTSGLTLEISYNDGKSESVTSGFGTDYDFSEPGEKVVTLTYGNQSTSYTVNVKELKVESISIMTLPSKTELLEGEMLDTTGLSLKLLYNNGKEELATSGFDCEPKTFSTVGTQTVHVSYEGASADFTVSVQAKSITSLSAVYSNDKTYYVGDSFSTTGLTVTAKYDNGSNSTIPASDCQINYDFSSAGTKTVKISYGGKTADISVTVQTLTVLYIGAVFSNNRTYYIGDTINPSDLTVTAVYKNYSSDTIPASSCQISYDFSSAGSKVVSVTYGGQTSTVKVTVNTPQITISKGSTGSSTIQLSAQTLPSGQSVTWTSEDSQIASINSSGIATAKSEGSARFSATFVYNGRAYSTTITISAKKVSKEGTWSAFQDEEIKATSTLKVETRETVIGTQYFLAHYCTGYGCGTHSYFTSYTNQTDDSTFNSKCSYHELGWINSTEVTRSDGNGTSYWEYETGHRYAYKYGSYKCANTCYLWYIMDTRNITKTQYRSCPITISYEWG